MVGKSGGVGVWYLGVSVPPSTGIRAVPSPRPPLPALTAPPTAPPLVPLEPPSPDDVERARRGDAAAFERLYREHVGRVYALCLRMSGDARDAEELTQDVFVRAWEKLPLFRGESAVGTWLHRLAVNVVLEGARRDRRRLARVDVRADDRLERLGAAAHGATPEERLTLEAAVAALPPAVRAVFVLHDIEGYKHEEIARLTGRAAGTLRAQLHRARKLLLEALR